MDKKGQISSSVWSIAGVAVAFVVVALVLAFGLMILGDTKTDMTANSAEANATGEGITAVTKFTTKLPLVATVIIAVVIIGLLIMGFGGMLGRK